MKTTNVLLVEGQDDLHCLVGLIKTWQLPITVTARSKTIVQWKDAVASVEIRDKQGWETLRNTLDVDFDTSDLKRLGILVDADNYPDRRYQSLRDFLQERGYTDMPLTLENFPIVIAQTEKPRIGIWLMPDNKKKGMLEDFLEMLVPEENTLWPYAQSCVDSIPEKQRLFSQSDHHKAITHTYLAWQKQPGKPFGVAVSSGSFNAEAKIAQELKDWLTRLFLDLTP